MCIFRRITVYNQKARCVPPAIKLCFKSLLNNKSETVKVLQLAPDYVLETEKRCMYNFIQSCQQQQANKFLIPATVTLAITLAVCPFSLWIAYHTWGLWVTMQLNQKQTRKFRVPFILWSQNSTENLSYFYSKLKWDKMFIILVLLHIILWSFHTAKSLRNLDLLQSLGFEEKLILRWNAVIKLFPWHILLSNMIFSISTSV